MAKVVYGVSGEGSGHSSRARKMAGVIAVVKTLVSSAGASVVR